MVIYFNFSGPKNRYHALESGVTSLIPAVGNSWFKIQIFPSLLSTAIQDGRFFCALFSLGLRNLGGYDTPLLNDDPLYRPFGHSGKI